MASPYSPADRRRAAAAVVAFGNSKAAGRAVGIPASTLREWRQNDEGFQRLCTELEVEHGEKLRAEIVEILGLASAELRDRLLNGDEGFHPKTGERVRTRLKGRDLAVVLGISFDKLRLIENQPTRITAQVPDLAELAQSFASLAQGPQVVAVQRLDRQGDG